MLTESIFIRLLNKLLRILHNKKGKGRKTMQVQ